MSDYLEKIRDLRVSDYTREDLDRIADEMEDILGLSTMWETIRVGFENSEFLENLEYIARENDL